MKRKDLIVLCRGGGDLASGTAVKLFKSGFPVVVTEIKKPLVVRRSVAFANCVYEDTWEIEGVKGKLAKNYQEAFDLMDSDIIPVIIDPEGLTIEQIKPAVIVDGIMAKNNVLTKIDQAKIVIGLGPGFVAGKDVHAIIETKSGHYLGMVITEGSAEKDDGIPCNIEGYTSERVFRAPCDGLLKNEVDIDDIVEEGQVLCRVDGIEVKSELSGVVRGIIHDGFEVKKGLKLGDVDHRGDPRYNRYVSDKVRNIAGGVLEAVLRFTAERDLEIN